MQHRLLGRTGAEVSEVGMGCNRLGENIENDDHWVHLVQRAVDLGVTLFDTSEQYAKKRSEVILGKAIGNRDGVLIATKMARGHEEGETDFCAARMLRIVEESLQRLKRDCIDIYQLHSPSLQEIQGGDWQDGMARLKQEGKIRFSAVAVNNSESAIWCMENTDVQVLQLTHNILYSDLDETTARLAGEKGVAIMARLPMARGVLTGKFRPDQEIPGHHRATLDGQRLADRVSRAEDLRPLAERVDGGMHRLAMMYALRPSQISAIIPGARTVEQLEQNVSVSGTEPLSESVLAEIERIQLRWKESAATA